MNKVLIVCGPTGVGKTALAIILARKIGGEIISADSRQVYKGMDIGTGKDLPVSAKFNDLSSKFQIKNDKLRIGYREKDNIPIWLVDIVEPDYLFNVGEYTILARQVIKYLGEKGKLPILVGGTQLYLKSAVEQLAFVTIPPIMTLREQLTKLPVTEIQQKLEVLDPQKWKSMNHSDRYNPRRLVRAIEIAMWKKRHAPLLLRKDHILAYDPLWIGLKTPTERLYKNISRRVDERVREGIIDEVTSLRKRGYSWESGALSAIGYREWKLLLETSTIQYEMTRKQLITLITEQWKIHEKKYARKQMDVFYANKTEKKIQWFDTSAPNWKRQIWVKVNKWYNN
ncbi:MAG: tRNA (adenosine(37)-N6)-dimethylallyltransferase MiaA [Patescibacteria group bacterium]